MNQMSKNSIVSLPPNPRNRCRKNRSQFQSTPRLSFNPGHNPSLTSLPLFRLPLKMRSLINHHNHRLGKRTMRKTGGQWFQQHPHTTHMIHPHTKSLKSLSSIEFPSSDNP
ncbi:hypothetical protein Dimus_038621 [Dionaea muscipula]